jgi:peptidoglycan hydrolase-like protein with peptidoglycan-binding domain
MSQLHAIAGITGLLATTVLLGGVGGGSAFGTPRAAVVAPTAMTATTATLTVSRTVTNAQRLLNENGCDAGTVDGRAGTHTTSAVIRFQAANWLSQSGTLTTATWDKLAAARKVACDKRPVPASSGTGRRMVVDRTQNWIWLVRSDGTTRWQGGLIDNPDVWRSGTYRSGSACGRPAHSRYGLDYSKTLRLDYFTRVVTGLCGVGFHRVPVYRSSGNQIHPDWYLGTNLKESHGCMRVTMRTAQEITWFTANSTKVVVKP